MRCILLLKIGLRKILDVDMRGIVWINIKNVKKAISFNFLLKKNNILKKIHRKIRFMS